MNRCLADLASQFGKCESFTDDLSNSSVESASIIKDFAIVVAEHLFIEVTE